MRLATVENLSRACVLGTRIGLADRWWLRLRGMLGRAPPSAGEGLLLVPCAAVHMHGMRDPLDVLFLGPDGAVVAVYAHLAPGGRTGWHRGARAALELPPGTLARTGTHVGDRLRWWAAPPPHRPAPDPGAMPCT